MPRIIDVETEAFAPTYRSTYQPPREDPREAELRRMGAKMQLAGQALPFISEGIKGLDEYLVTPIQKALKEGREEEYKAKKAGETPFDIGETTRQKIARERIAEKEKQKPFDTSAWEKEELDREAMEKDLFGKGDVWRLDVPLGKTDESQPEEQPITPEERAIGQAFKKKFAEAGQQFGDAFRPSVTTGLERPMKFTGEAPAPTRMMPEHPVPTGYQWPARGRAMIAAGKPEEGFAGAEAPAAPTQTAQMAKMATTTARGGAPAAAELAAPAAPAKPKTLADVTDDELSDVKRRLEKLVKQNPADKELADRLESVNLEQRHREEKIEFEDWAPMARAADTLEEQRKVLELAKRVRMPAEGLESLLRSPFERAKLKALGTREEKGLFPEVARPLSEWEIDKKKMEVRIGELKAQGMSERQAADQALAEKRRAEAGLAGAKTTRIQTLLEPEYAAAAEKPFLMHSQEELNEAKRQEVLGLLPKKIQKYDADIARLRRMAAAKSGGRGLSKEDIEWAKLWEKDWDKAVDNAANVATNAKREAVTLERQAAAAQMEAEGKAGDYREYEKIFAKISPYDPNYAKVQADLFEKRAAAGAAQRSATLAKANFEAARTASGEAQTKLEQAQKAGDEGRQHLRFIYGRSGPGRAEAGAVPAAPAAPAKPATTPAKVAVTHKEGDKSKDKNGKPIVWHDGKWTYPD